MALLLGLVFASTYAPYVLLLLALLGAAGIGLLVWRAVRRERIRQRIQQRRELIRQRRHQQWLARLARTRTLEDLLTFNPRDFELFVGTLLQVWGYQNVQHTGGSRDLAADLTCWTPDGQQFVVVQCKRYRDKPVGSQDMQTFFAMAIAHHRAHLGIFVTTSRFTQPALDLARQHNLRTIDGQELAQHNLVIKQWLQQQEQQLA